MSNATLLLSEKQLGDLFTDDWVDMPDVSELYSTPINKIMENN
jgi:hypothetical protein